jgi:hypothetical protein
MTASLKMLGLTVIVLGAVAAPAQAATFHKPAETIKLKVTPDGTTTTAHQVWDAAGASMTCSLLTGSAEVVGTGTTFSEVTTSSSEYTGCKFIGQTATVNLHGCNYTLVAAAEGVGATIKTVCPAGSEIEFSVPSPSCVVQIPGGQTLTGLTYHNINTKSEVTTEAHVGGAKYSATGAGCPEAGIKENGTTTTGNVIITAENTAGTMKSVFVE